nr:MAG TPA_asm: hypothetical protein [Caudoviricetes sp.]
MNDYQTIERYPITYRSNVVHSAFQEMRYRKCTNGFLPKNKKWTLEARCFKSPHIKRFPRFGVRKVLLSIRGFSFRNHIAQSKDSKDNQKRSPHFHQPFPLLPVDIQQDCFHNIYNNFKYS